MYNVLILYPRNEATAESQRNWDGIREFFDCNSHLSVDHSKPAPKVLLKRYTFCNNKCNNNYNFYFSLQFRTKIAKQQGFHRIFLFKFLKFKMMSMKQLYTVSLLPLAYEVQGKAMFSVCLMTGGGGFPRSCPGPVWPSPVWGRGYPQTGTWQGGVTLRCYVLRYSLFSVLGFKVLCAICGRQIHQPWYWFQWDC